MFGSEREKTITEESIGLYGEGLELLLQAP